MNYIQKKLEQLIKKLQKENDLETANKIEINSYRIIDYYSQKIENTNQEIGSYWFSIYNEKLWFFLRNKNKEWILKEYLDLEFFIDFPKWLKKQIEYQKKALESIKETQQDKIKNIENLKS